MNEDQFSQENEILRERNIEYRDLMGISFFLLQKAKFEIPQDAEARDMYLEELKKHGVGTKEPEVQVSKVRD